MTSEITPAPHEHAKPYAAYRMMTGAAELLMRGLRMKITMTGTEHVPDRPSIIAFQHCSPVDGVVLGGILGRLGHTPTVLLKRQVTSAPVIGPLLVKAGAIPVGRFDKSSTPDPVVVSAQRLQEGRTLLLAPEGGLSRSFSVLPLRTGAARLAHAQDVPLVPCVTVGIQRLGGIGGQKLKPKLGLPVSIAFGPAVPTTGDARADTDQLQAAMTKLLAAAQDDYPDDGTGEWWWPEARGGAARNHDEYVAEHNARFVTPKDDDAASA